MVIRVNEEMIIQEQKELVVETTDKWETVED
jgi:hypothetical protein